MTDNIGKLITDDIGMVANPYSWNYVVQKQKEKFNERKITPQMEEMLTTPLYNQIGKFFGINTKAEWGQYYPDVFEVTEWAKEKTKSEDPGTIVQKLTEVINNSPTLNDKRIKDVLIQIRLGNTDYKKEVADNE